MRLGKAHLRPWNPRLKPTTMTLATVRLLVDDFVACHRFYTHVLGFTPRFGKADALYEEFDCGAVVVALFDRSLVVDAAGLSGEPATPSSASPVILAFAVNDVDRSAALLREKASASSPSPPTNRNGV